MSRERLSIIDSGDSAAILIFENGGIHDLTGVSDAFEKEGEAAIRDALSTRLQDAAESEFRRLQRAGAGLKQISIIGDESFHRYPWEALCRSQSGPFQDAAIVRRIKGNQEYAPAPSSEDVLRMLFVTARPTLHDVPPRAVLGPVLRATEQGEYSQPKITVLRSGTFEAMATRLQRQFTIGEPVQILHLDMHGLLDTVQVDGEEREQALLLFERPPDILRGGSWLGPNPVPAKRLAEVVVASGVQVIVLNACNSAVGDRGANLAYHVASHGVPAVLGMRKPITVAAAAEFCASFYQNLCGARMRDQPVTESVRQARRALRHLPEQYADELTTPTLFMTKTPHLSLNPAPDHVYEHRQRRIEQAERRRPREALFGRSSDEHLIRAHLFGSRSEGVVRRDAREQPLQIVGWTGVGKTALMKHLAAHWIDTDLIDHCHWLDIADHRPSGGSPLDALDALDNMTASSDFVYSDVNLVVVDNADCINPEQGQRFWEKLVALHSQNNYVVAIGRHFRWVDGPSTSDRVPGHASGFVPQSTRRFTMFGLDFASALRVLARVSNTTAKETRSEDAQEVAFGHGAVPQVLEVLARLSSTHGWTDLLGALELSPHEDRPADTWTLIEELADLFTPPALLDPTSNRPIRELSGFGRTDRGGWLTRDELIDCCGDAASTVEDEGLVVEVPLEAGAAGGPPSPLYVMHPQLRLIGQAAMTQGERDALSGEWDLWPPGDIEPNVVFEEATERITTYWGGDFYKPSVSVEPR